jgi:TatD DNase family protein
MHLTDSHAHLDMVPPADLPNLLARAYAANVKTILAIGIGEGPAHMHRALELANAPLAPNTPTIYASAGIHPQEAHHATPEALAQLAALAQQKRCIAIGEIGLDYYHLENPSIPIQQAAFIAQLRIAAAARKPILIHCRTSDLATPAAKAKFTQPGAPSKLRLGGMAPPENPADAPADAWHDLLTLLAQHWTPTHRGPTPAGIMHCFSGTVDHARRSLDLGFHLSFAGNLTYPAAHTIREAAAFAPPDRILIETDSPFLAPIPHRGQPNEPALIGHTAAALATLRNLTLPALAALTTANFQTLFPTTAP